MCGAPERLPAFDARTFSTVITTYLVEDLNEKIAGVDCMMHWLYMLRCTYRSRAEVYSVLSLFDLNGLGYGNKQIIFASHLPQ
jgi:hypothetical protein